MIGTTTKSRARHALLTLVLGGIFAATPCCCGFSNPAFGDAPRPTSAAAECHVLAIEGMTCESCSAHVRTALAKVPGVAEARVDFAKAEAVVCAKPGAVVNAASLIAAVKKAGYKATLKK